MGQSESSTATGGKGGASARRSSSDNNNKARYQLRSTSKAPAKVIINKPKVQEGKAILRVPHTNVKIMHVDPTERAGIVPTHGYIALQIVPPEEREAAEAAGMDPLQMISPTAGGGGSSTRAKAKRARNGGGKKNNGGSAATTPRNRRGFGDNGSESGITSGDDGVTSEMSQQVGDEVVDAGMDPEYAAMLNRARQEYSADTHRNVTREVKKWKAAFSLENGRAPNKKDIAGNPFIYQQYYMEKELEAMKKLLDENERAEAEAQREAAWLEQNRAMQTQQNNLVRDLTDLEVARSEYNAMEFVDLQREVKKWKSDFKKLQNRPPTKKDVADSPEIYDKYYRLKDLEAMKKLMDDADAMERSVLAKNNMRGGGNTGGGGGSFRGEIGSINSGSVDPIEYAKAQFDSSEYASLQHEVRQWKVAFKSARGRPPTKRDISEDPEIFAKYYREKELEAMKKLIEDTEATMRRASVIDGFET
ncbi:Hypothetical protein, putative [Bodo saltans]|uniref:Uncharacterized protein n=1 Tax=Bodo saltans TaxID=75058 RepID=A0A0S4JH70_BODSA|nr:Hypothetical protein, putative [Bodo saltans]|eukprot:CUG90886.1 Hypothetical protein, putative [Bodo saltans]